MRLVKYLVGFACIVLWLSACINLKKVELTNAVKVEPAPVKYIEAVGIHLTKNNIKYYVNGANYWYGMHSGSFAK